MKKSLFLKLTDKLYKKSELDLADDLKDAVEGDEVKDDVAEKLIEKLDAEKVTGFKTKETERFDNGVKKGQKDTAVKFEKRLKKTFNVTEDLEGDELLQHIEENLPEPGKPGEKPDLSKLTEEDLKKVPAFILKQREFETKLSEKESEKTTAVQAEKDKQNQSLIFGEASAKALALLESKKPVLPTDANKALTLKNRLLIDELKGYTFMKGTDGKLIPLDSEGKAVESKNGVPVDFDSLVSGIIDQNFEFNITTPRTTPGNKNKPGQSGNDEGENAYKGTKPSSNKEYIEFLTGDDLSGAEKAGLIELYSEEFGD